MKYISLFVIGFISACGRYTEPAFAPYVAEFRVAAEARGVVDTSADLGTSVEFGEPHAGKMATCFYSPLGARVVVSRAIWDDTKFTEERRLLIFHELGHCVLGRSHVAGDSIMAVGPPENYIARWDALLDELFLEE